MVRNNKARRSTKNRLLAWRDRAHGNLPRLVAVEGAGVILAIWHNLRYALIVWMGAHFTGMAALFLLRIQGTAWREAGITAALVGCIGGMLLAVMACWGIRYPAPMEIKHVHLVKREAGTVVKKAEWGELPPGDFMQLTVPAPVNWPNVARFKLHEAIQAALKTGYVSVRVMRKHSKLTDAEAGTFRDWLARNGIGEIDGRGGLVVTASGREDLERLSPIARGLR